MGNNDITYQWVDDLRDEDGVEQASRIDMLLGICYLNRPWLQNATPAQLCFIKNHEKAHYIYRTGNEFFCDTFGFHQCMAKSFPLSSIVDAHSYMLEVGRENANTDERDARVRNILRLAGQYDYYVNKNDTKDLTY